MLNRIEASYYSSPGAEIAGWLKEHHKTQEWLAHKLGKSRKYVNELVNAKARLNEFTAIDLSEVLGMTPEYWLMREASYRLALALAARQNIEVEQEDGSFSKAEFTQKFASSY